MALGSCGSGVLSVLRFHEGEFAGFSLHYVQRWTRDGVFGVQYWVPGRNDFV